MLDQTVPSKSDRVRELNDKFRSTFVGGVVTLTQGMEEQCRELKAEVLRRIREFKYFNEDNDPHGEHDFGSFNIGGSRFFWKIDYYDRDLLNGSEDPATRRRRRACSRSCWLRSTDHALQREAHVRARYVHGRKSWRQMVL